MVSKPPTEARIAREIEKVLVDRLPSTWKVGSRVTGVPDEVDLIIGVTPPTGATTNLAVEIKRTIEPRSIPEVATQAASLVESAGIDATPVVAAGYLSPRSRQLLEDFGVSYLDTTGNIRIDAPSAGLFVQTDGADKDPWPQDRNLQTLRGRGAARTLRAIVDTAPPFGVRELAAKTNTSPATVSRVLELLQTESIVTRQPRGPVLAVDWQGAIRRWAEDYDQNASNVPNTYLAPRGIPFVEDKLKSFRRLRYAATGAFAAQRFNPIAPARTAALYVDDVVKTADRLALREVDGGANVVLLEPFDPVVFDRTIDRDGLRCVAPTQLAADLLTGPGREPSQGEEILAWMKENEDVWRT